MTVNADDVLADHLLTVLRSVTCAPALAYSRAPVRLTGGFWAELFAFSLMQPPDGWPRDLVVRIMPQADTARRETAIQRTVAAAGFPTPVVRAAGGPDDGLGDAFMIMDRAPGTPSSASNRPRTRSGLWRRRKSNSALGRPDGDSEAATRRRIW